MTMLKKSFSLLCVSASWILPAVHAQSENVCTLCFGGDEPTLTNTVGGAADGLPCSFLVEDDNAGLSESDCNNLQLLGYRWCGCPQYPEDYFCSMCDNAFADIPNLFQEIPGTDGDTCDERLFVPAESVSDCQEAMIPGYFCGCPDATCFICGVDNEVADPDATFEFDGSTLTCGEVVDLATDGSLSGAECRQAQVDLPEICGCNNAPVPPTDETTPAPTVETEVPDNTNVETDPPQVTPEETVTDPPLDVTDDADDSAASVSQPLSILPLIGMIVMLAVTMN